jgi:AIPR protein.
MYGGLIMQDFRKQISEDINLIREENKYIKNIKKDEWVFNYWILDNIFNVDQELIETQIIDYNDLGVDAFVFFSETKNLYIIQNKYYSDSSVLTTEYVKNDFLLRAVTALKNNTYTRSKELQNIFNKYKNHNDFTVHLELYVTNNNKNDFALSHIKEFNLRSAKFVANLYYLNDIKEKYYGEMVQKVNKLTVEIDTIVKGTVLNINNTSYKLKNVIDARYVFTPITTIYRIYREAIEKQYPIFDMNIREYLGNTGVNKNIIATLLDKEDRVNFFYYNNGITLICNEMSSIQTVSSKFNRNAKFSIKNPQIVNGCQTVNSIYEVLKNVDPNILEDEYKDTFVMLKVLQIDDSNEYERKLYKDIVKFNNSQNSIDEKTFVSNNSLFLRFQRELEKRGFLLLIKQSDKNTFKNKYKSMSNLKEKSIDYLQKYELDFNKITDFFIPLEKLLQIALAFKSGGFDAFTKKSSILKLNSESYNIATDFLKNDNVTIDVLIDLWLLYYLSESIKKQSKDGRTPISYYLIDCFAKYDCQDRNISLISSQLNSINKIKQIVILYSRVTKAYANEYYNKNNIDYNLMIKKPVQYHLLEKYINVLKNV